VIGSDVKKPWDLHNNAIDNEPIEEVDHVQISDVMIYRVGFKDVENTLVTCETNFGTKT
jgi:hypothetical protein